MSIPFVQYLRPRGTPKPIRIDRPHAIEAKAEQIIAAGYRFEAEVLTDDVTVSLTVHDPREGDDVAIELVANGAGVPDAVDRLVGKAYADLVEHGAVAGMHVDPPCGGHPRCRTHRGGSHGFTSTDECRT